MISSAKLLPTVLATYLSLIPLQNGMGQVNNTSTRRGNISRTQITRQTPFLAISKTDSEFSGARYRETPTPLDPSRITFNEDISFLSAPEQELFRKWKSKFFESLKRLPEKDQNKLKEAYKWTPDIVKIIASRDDKDRRNDAYKIYPGSKLYSNIKQVLSQKLYSEQKSELSNPKGIDYILSICGQMVTFQYPLRMLYVKNTVQSSNGLTPLDLSRMTFNEDISFLSEAEQTRFKKWKAEFFESLKLLPPQDQRELKEVYKWTPDVVKIIASRDVQERKRGEYCIYPFFPRSQLFSYMWHALNQKLAFKKKSEISNVRGVAYVIEVCMEMVEHQYPLKMVHAQKQQSMTTARIPLTRLNLSRITFGDNISFLSAPEQERYKRCQAEFFESLKRLPEKEQQELREAYKLVPDVVKIIASRSYQSRKGYEIRSGTMFYTYIKNALNRKLSSKQRFGGTDPEELNYILELCRQMIRYRYPLNTFDIENQDIDENAKKAGFGYLARMIDFGNDSSNIRLQYRRCVDIQTYDRTIEEMKVFEKIGSRYEDAIWKDFKEHSYAAVYKFWKFDLKKVDTSNLTATEYEKMQQQLKCVPPEILIRARFLSYDGRMANPKYREILKDPSYVKKYALKKGISLSETEVQEVHQLASEILIYGTPLKLVKRDNTADLEKVADNYGFTKVGGYCSFYKDKKKKRLRAQFYEYHPEHIPLFMQQARLFYALGMIINPEQTKIIYDDMKITLQHPRYAPYIKNGLQDLKQYTRAQ